MLARAVDSMHTSYELIREAERGVQRTARRA